MHPVKGPIAHDFWLTVAPQSWSIQVTEKTFGVSEHMVEMAWNITKERAICTLSGVKVGKPLPKENASRVWDFYKDDDFNRLCPSIKERIVFPFAWMASRFKNKSGCYCAIWKNCMWHVERNMVLKLVSINSVNSRQSGVSPSVPQAPVSAGIASENVKLYQWLLAACANVDTQFHWNLWWSSRGPQTTWHEMTPEETREHYTKHSMLG